jgi:iron complex transport system substrate-binding protein
MRRSTLPLLIAAGALAVSLTACGSDSDDADSTAGGSDDSTSEGSAFPVSIENKYGTAEITEEPQRVVTVGLTEQDALLALGVVPVATTKWFDTHPGEIFPWAEGALGDADLPEVLEDEKQFEKVAALQPDLIVAMYSSITKEDYEKYAAIAPTLAAPDGYVDYGVPWQEATRTIGEALGKADEADSMVSDVEDKIAQAAEDHPEFQGQEAATVTIYEGIFVYGPEDPRGRLLTDLGFVYPAAVSEELPEDFGGSISVENADLVDVDSLVWVNDQATTTKAVPQYKNLNVSKEGRDVFIPTDDPIYEATSFQSVLSVPFLIDGLVPRLAAAADGDTSTPTDG